MMVNQTQEFVKVCRKLDQLRFTGTIDWGSLGKNIHKNDRLMASTRLLLFWLCSIIDQFYGYIRIWTYGERAMLKLLEDNPRSFSDVTNKIKNLRRDRRGNTVGDIPIDHERFTLVRDDHERIKNTFDFLSKYGNHGIYSYSNFISSALKFPSDLYSPLYR
jgi:hypothetical protein